MQARIIASNLSINLLPKHFVVFEFHLVSDCFHSAIQFLSHSISVRFYPSTNKKNDSSIEDTIDVQVTHNLSTHGTGVTGTLQEDRTQVESMEKVAPRTVFVR